MLTAILATAMHTPVPPPPPPDDHRILVPPACGAALAAIYSGTIPELQVAGKLPQKLDDIVVIVCGGSGVNVDTIYSWKKAYDL